ncbi:AraC family transcriptional regulator [Pseudoxanthomonas indica]|uniref:AraC-type DNA-binding protein n=1 Tax=Pseudoxanthomonas indica TaxID=428993 RepID=A0A1T5J507_9GAMM|nr:AraC family transcriptional regulator [Pseudoxanthomonas indica]GGD56422.1 transcriptional regulator [Pseudoxanthomonas indica]SKC46421.1 AraC-type DNA-binding protein [Pseudoxanthomonas indica]
MSDPLSHVMQLLHPRAVFSKGISGAGDWAVRYSEFGEPSFCAVLEGGCRLDVDGQERLDLIAGDFLLLPATPGFTMAAGESERPVQVDPAHSQGSVAEIRHGRADGPAEFRLLGGWFQFDAADPGLLASLLPQAVHVRGVPRLTALVRMVREETDASRPGQGAVLGRLVELLLVEALRAAPAQASPGLLRGLADARLAAALVELHARPERAWTMTQLAEQAALSRSAFFERFTRVVGVAPMEYLLAWRMSLARMLLRQPNADLTDVAERVGYSSASTFSTAFSRRVGLSPGRYARSSA